MKNFGWILFYSALFGANIASIYIGIVKENPWAIAVNSTAACLVLVISIGIAVASFRGDI